MSHTTRSILLGVLLLCIQYFPARSQRYEAESAVLSGSAAKAVCTGCSGGQYVSMNDGNLTFNINSQSEGYYNVVLRVASPSGNKINTFWIDDNSVDFATGNANYISLTIAGAIRMSSGSHTLKITKSWGYINIDYVELEQVSPGSRYIINTTLVTPSPSDHAKRLYQFLYDNYGRKIISGVMTLNSFDETTWLRDNAGKEPALVGLDFMHSGRGYNWYNDKQPIIDAKTWYDRNGIPAMCWHWRDPLRTTEEFYTANTTFDVSKIFNESSPEYQAMIADIDFVAGLLKELRDQGVPVIWRPLHEASGGWFWWGAKGPAACKKLYQVMFERMVNHHGLNNLIWVWTREPNDDEWYPGDQYVDIVGRDIYKDGNHSSQVLEWSDLNQRYSKKKIVTLSETGSFPDVDNLIRDGAAWSWWMPWYGKHTREAQYNPLTLWQKNLSSEYVITLDEMPDLKTYEATTPPVDPVLSSDMEKEFNCEMYPTIVTQQLTIACGGRNKKLTIYDAQGKRMYEKIMERDSMIVTVSDWNAGVYYVKCDGRPALRFVKQ